MHSTSYKRSQLWPSVNLIHTMVSYQETFTAWTVFMGPEIFSGFGF